MTIGNLTSGLSDFTFDEIDYTVFALTLCISASIGIYFGFIAKKANTTDEYLMGGKRMKSLPIAISLVASQLSAIAIMTIPAEMYSYGINWMFNLASMIVIVPLLNCIVVPVFYNNNLTNCYEYLEKRFNRQTRDLQTFAFVATFLFMLPMYIFVPSMAFAQVSGLNVHLINGFVCAICVFYTMVGGIKAVVWTDVVQAGIMLCSVILVCVLGTIKVGGVTEVWRVAKAGQRLDVNFNLDATTRSTAWNAFTSAAVLWTAYVGLNQSCVQRIVSLPTLKQAKRSMLLFGIGCVLILGFTSITGIVMYVRYHDCDPILTGHVSKPDKLMPYFVQDAVGHIRGLPGIFISCVFSAALSTMSASLNALAGIVYLDYVRPRIKHTELRANLIMKTIVLAFGVYSIAGGFLVERFSSILQLLYSIFGVTFGSVFGVFLMGMLVPRAHGRAALIAILSSLLAMLIIVFGAQGRMRYKPLPTSIEGCLDPNMTIIKPPIFLTNLGDTSEHPFGVIFKVSFNWYVVIGAVIVWLVGVPLSYILKPWKSDAPFNPKLLAPIIRRLGRFEDTTAVVTAL